MTKKIISLLILAAMLCGFATMPVATAAEADEKIGEYLELLVNIGAIDESYMNASMNGNVSRGEFAQIVHKYLKIADLTESGNRAFVDVAEDHQYFAAIESLAKTNIIEGHGMNMYHPGNNVTWDQAATVLVRAAGWESEVQSINGMPENYYVVACSRDIFKAPGAQNASMTYADVFRVLYDALTADYNQLVGVGPNGANYEFNENVNILSEIYDVYKSRGIISANEVTTLDPDEVVTSKGYIRIDGEDYAASGYADLLGYNVEFYYRDADYDYEIMQISVLESRTEVEKIYSRQNLKYDSGVYRYTTEPSHKKESIKLENDAVILYNDKLVTSGDISQKMVPVNGYIEIIDNTEYQILKIYDSTNIVVGGLNKETLTIYDKRAQFTYSLESEDKNFEDYQIITPDGAEITFDEIKPDQAIAIFESLDGKFVKLLICDEALNATITAIDESADGKTVLELKDVEFNTVKEYYVATNLMNEDFNFLDFCQLKVGSVAKFILDPGGNIMDCVLDSTDRSGEYSLGYLYNFRLLDETEGGGTILMGIYDVNTKTVNQYQSTEKPKINGKRLRDTRLAYIRYLQQWGTVAVDEKLDEDALRLIKAEPMLVQYKLTADGANWDEIVQAQGLAAETDAKVTGFTKVFDGIGQTIYCKTYRKNIGGKIVYTDKTQVLEVPRSDYRSTASKYTLSGSGYFADNSGYRDLEAYSLTDSKYTIDIVVRVDRSSPGASATADRNNATKKFSVFNKFTTEVDEEEEVALYANFYDTETAVKYKDTYNFIGDLEKNKGLEFGDLVYYEVKAGAIVYAVKCYDASTGEVDFSNSAVKNKPLNDYHHYGVYAIENVKSGTGLLREANLVNNKPSGVKPDSSVFIPMSILALYNVDLENRTITRVDANQVITSEHSENNFTRLVVDLELLAYGKAFLYNVE